MRELQKGIYQHYKGNRYEVIGLAMHTETQEDLVVYKALYKTGFDENMLWVRPRKMFQENVVIEGKDIPRFQYLNE